MIDEVLNLSSAHGIATITLNRPDKRNALNGVLIETLLNTLKKFSEDNSIRVLLINGSGEHFCSGADIGWMHKVASGSYSENYDDAQMLADLLYYLYSFPKPTIALAHGITLGGGMGLISACDIAIAANNAMFGFSEVKIGVTPSIISPYILAAMGERAAHYYFLTGSRFHAQEAYRSGLVHQITEPQALMSTGILIAKEILQNGPHALIAAKQLIRHVAKEKISQALVQKTAEHLANLRTTPESQEGLQAFLEKRSPHWQGES